MKKFSEYLMSEGWDEYWAQHKSPAERVASRTKRIVADADRDSRQNFTSILSAYIRKHGLEHEETKKYIGKVNQRFGEKAGKRVISKATKLANEKSLKRP